MGKEALDEPHKSVRTVTESCSVIVFPSRLLGTMPALVTMILVEEDLEPGASGLGVRGVVCPDEQNVVGRT